MSLRLFFLSLLLGLSSLKAEIYTLSIIHMADQEAAMDALFDAPNASSVVNALKDDYENTIILSSGDNYIAGPFLKASADSAMESIVGATGVSGRADILINNRLGIQASVVGNHEFDEGPELFNSLLTPEGDYPGPSFPYLSTNLDFSKTELAGKIAPSTIIEVNEKRIGIIGATTPTLPVISSIGGIQVVPAASQDHRALAAEVQKSVDALSSQGIEIIILLAHMQDLGIELELAGYLKDVDVIIGGGSDSILLDENDRARVGDAELVYGPYPIWKESASGDQVAVLNTDGQYRYVGRLVAQFDAEGKIIQSYDSEVSGAFATDEAGVAALGNEPADEKIVEIIDGLKELILGKDQNVLGYTTEYLDARKSVIRSQPTNLGTLITKANLWYARRYSGVQVDVCIANAGGMRASIGIETVLPGETEVSFLPNEATSYKKRGAITQLDIESAQAFNNELVLVTLTGAQIKETLEEGLRLLPSPHGGFPQVAGFEYVVDPSKPAGERIEKIMLGEQPIVFEKAYRVVTLKYLATGGNGYPIEGYIDDTPEAAKFLNLTEQNLPAGTSTFSQPGTEQDALAEYLIEHHSNP